MEFAGKWTKINKLYKDFSEKICIIRLQLKNYRFIKLGVLSTKRFVWKWCNFIPIFCHHYQARLKSKFWIGFSFLVSDNLSLFWLFASHETSYWDEFFRKFCEHLKKIQNLRKKYTILSWKPFETNSNTLWINLKWIFMNFL